MALTLFIIYVLGGLLLYLFQDRFIFHPTPLSRDHRFSFDHPFKELNIAVEGRNLNLVQFPSQKKKGVLLYFHGNMDNVERYGSVAPLFTDSGYEVWMMDYPGFGKTTGSLNEKTVYSDAERIYQMAIEKFPASEIVIYGRSLGTGIAAQLAGAHPCKMLLLETPYYSMKSLARTYFPIYPIGRLAKYNFSVHDYLGKVTAPIYLLHGDRDEVVPYSQSVRLRKEHPGVHLVTIPDGRHNDLADYEVYRSTVKRLLGT
jgi:hypothetical protein